MICNDYSIVVYIHYYDGQYIIQDKVNKFNIQSNKKIEKTKKETPGGKEVTISVDEL